MLITSANPEHRGYKVYDVRGAKVEGVFSYDTVTKEVEMAVFSGKRALRVITPQGQEPLRVKCVLAGSFATDQIGRRLA